MKELATDWVCIKGWKLSFNKITKDFVIGKFQYINGESNSFNGIINDKLELCFVVELPEGSIKPSSLFNFHGKFIINDTITKLSLNCCVSNLKTMKSKNLKLIFYKKEYIHEELIQMNED